MEYQRRLVSIAGQKNATSIIQGGIYLISAGSSDFLQNYYINPLLYKIYSPEDFSTVLTQEFADFVQVSCLYHHLLFISSITCKTW